MVLRLQRSLRLLKGKGRHPKSALMHLPEMDEVVEKVFSQPIGAVCVLMTERTDAEVREDGWIMNVRVVSVLP